MPESRNIRAGIMIAEKKAKNPSQEFKPGLIQRGFNTIKNTIKTSKAGFDAGRAAGGGFGAMANAYKKAGGVKQL